MGTRTRKSWKLDSQGQYARQIGWQRSRNGKLVQHKFRLGDELGEAKRRERRLREFWEGIEATSTEQPPVWTPFTLHIAKQIEKGKTLIELPRKPHDSPQAYARYIHRIQRHYPMISFVAQDEEAYVQGAVSNKGFVEGEIAVAVEEVENRHLRIGNVSRIDIPSNNGTLHEAMRAYIAWIKQEYYRTELGRITGNGRTKVRQVSTLIERHDNVPLSCVDYDQAERMVRFWRQRPFKKNTTKPITTKSAQNYIGELKRFFNWLHTSKNFDWRKPDDFEQISTKVDPSPSAKQRRLAQVDTFSKDELCLLNKYATPLERVFLLLGINCGFGTAEVASMLIGEVVLFQAHKKRYQEILRYETTNADSFIKRVRRKNGVYGEHILFPQTVEAMQWALERRKREPHPEQEAILLLNEKGQPYDEPTKGGNRNQQIPNRFADLVKRIRQDYADFPKLSFGKLRKTAGDLVRRFSDGEIMAVFHCRGQAVPTDDLADVYSNRPFGKVFHAIREVQDYLEPMFEVAGLTPFRAQPQAYTSRKTRDKMLELHEQGMPIRTIAEKVKKSRMAVYRHLKRQKEQQADD